MVTERQRAVVDRWVRALAPYRAHIRQGTSACARFAATGSLDDLVETLADWAARDGYCCELHGFPVRDPVMHPDAVIEAMLGRRVPPLDALRALTAQCPAPELDARIEAIPEDSRRALFVRDPAGWSTPLTALRLGVVVDELREWPDIGDFDEWSLSDALYDPFDPTRSSLALRTLLRTPSRRWVLDGFAQREALANALSAWPWLTEPDALRFVRALLSDSPDAIALALDAMDDHRPRIVAVPSDGREFDLRESFALLCARFGYGSLAERQLRAVLRSPAQRSFDGTSVAIAPHANTTQTVLASLSDASREALNDWAFCTLDRRDAAANEWIALARWSRGPRAHECFTRAVARINAVDRGDEPFEGALLPRPLQESTRASSEARLRRWLDARLRSNSVVASESEDAHFRFRWFSCENPAAIAVAYEWIREARAVAAATLQWGLEASAGRWMKDVESRCDSAIDAVLDELDPLHATFDPLTRSESAFEMFAQLFEFASSSDRARWIETIIERCPGAVRVAWPWADDEQRARMIQTALADARSLVTMVCERPSPRVFGALAAACMDRWVRLGCPLDSRWYRAELAKIQRYFADETRDASVNGWRLSREALRERLRAQLSRGALDWTIDPGAEWIARMLGDDPGDDALMDALFEQHCRGPEAMRLRDRPPECHPLGPTQRRFEEASTADVPPANEQQGSEELSRGWSPWGDPDEVRFALRSAMSDVIAPEARQIIAWMARIAPETLGPLGDRVLEVILTHHGR